MPEELIRRFTLGNGGFLGEVSLYTAPEEALVFARKGRPLWFLNDLFVHPLRRGRGWAGQLMQEAVWHAEKQRADVWLYVRPHGVRRTRDGRVVQRLDAEGLAAFYTTWGFYPLCFEPRVEMVRRC